MPVIETSFEVPADADTVWAYLLDIERVVPCMPGAQLTETIDDSHWKGKMRIKVGPVSLTFAGDVTMKERDEEAHRVVLEASAMEQRGKGAASATVTSSMESFDGGTRVAVSQDIKVSGQAAQFSRGMMEDVATRIVHQFADCLKGNMQSEGAAAPEGEVEAGDEVPAASGTSSEKPEKAIVTPAAPPGAGAAAELNVSTLVVGAAGRTLLRFLARVFGGVATLFGRLATALERIAGR
jgi:uncharacterized protein